MNNLIYKIMLAAILVHLCVLLAMPSFPLAVSYAFTLICSAALTNEIEKREVAAKATAIETTEKDAAIQDEISNLKTEIATIKMSMGQRR